MAPSLGWRGDSAALVKHGLDYFVARYQRPDGLFRTLVAADGSSLDDRALLYDQAFALLAFNVAAPVANRAPSASASRSSCTRWCMKHMKRAGQGFETGVPASLPLQSNPHMHLFEAALAGCEVCSESSLWKPLADEIAELALSKFIDRGHRRAARVLRRALESRARHPGTHRRARTPVRMGLAAAAVGRSEDTRAHAHAALKLIDIGETHGVRNGLATNSLLDDFSRA